jgi:hypothetical protein
MVKIYEIKRLTLLFSIHAQKALGYGPNYYSWQLTKGLVAVQELVGPSSMALCVVT